MLLNYFTAIRANPDSEKMWWSKSKSLVRVCMRDEVTAKSALAQELA
jgi:hypothetical protein